MSAVLRHVLLLQKDVQKAAHFYQHGLGLHVNVLTERWAELQAGSSKIALKAVDGCACLPNADQSLVKHGSSACIRPLDNNPEVLC